MKYSILGFNQKKVCAITKEVQINNKSKIQKLDMTDLIILQDISDFMNRKGIIKYTINEKIYFSITHNAILTDLPILDIKKQALKDRIDKMCLLGVIEKHIVRNENGTWIGYRLTDVYESLIYANDDDNRGVYQTTRGGCSKLHEGGVVNYNPNNYTTIKETTIKQNKEEIKELKEKFAKDELFEECWLAYRRKGKKGKAYPYWKKLTDDEKQLVLPHIKAYVQANELQFQQDFERYLRDKTFLSIVISKNTVVYDPATRTSGTYTPQGRTIWFNEETKSYWSDDNSYYESISDGYEDDNRPDGATLTLNNARGNITWNTQTKKWEKV